MSNSAPTGGPQSGAAAAGSDDGNLAVVLDSDAKEAQIGLASGEVCIPLAEVKWARRVLENGLGPSVSKVAGDERVGDLGNRRAKPVLEHAARPFHFGERDAPCSPDARPICASLASESSTTARFQSYRPSGGGTALRAACQSAPSST